MRAAQVFAGDFFCWKHCDKCDEVSDALGELGFCLDPHDIRGAYADYLTDYAPWTWDEERDVATLRNGRTVDEQIARVFPR